MSSANLKEIIMKILKTVDDPDLHRDLVSLNMVKGVEVEGDTVRLNIQLTTPACPLKSVIQKDIESKIFEIVPEIKKVHIEWGAQVASGLFGENRNLVPGVQNIVAVGSGTGGVGKSTVAANLAVSLVKTGATVGLLDADIYGPNIPLMMGIRNRPEVIADRLQPISNYGVKVMSMGFLLPEDTPVIWRGPMLNSALKQFFGDVEWGALDYLLVDLPPGTGDVQLSLVQLVPVTGAVMVTTPQEVALQDVRKAIQMFRQTKVEVLGIIENMSYFICPHCSERTDIFAYGGGSNAAEKLSLPFLGEIPLDTAIRKAGDSGMPVSVSHPDSPIAKTFLGVAQNLAARISVRNFESHEALSKS
ncbi:MAG: Mrp/NBP35 family ATP-binding protein [bacterium]